VKSTRKGKHDKEEEVKEVEKVEEREEEEEEGGEEEDGEEEEDEEDEEADEIGKQFEEELKEKAKMYPGKRYVMLDAWKPTTKGEKPTMEKLRELPVIFIHPDFFKVQQRVYKTLDKACDGLFMLWTSHSPIMWSVFGKEIKKVNALFAKGDYPGAFCQLLGTVFVMEDIDHWWNDVEETEPVEELMTSVASAFKKLATKTDEELGIQGDQPREKVIAYLRKWGETVKESENGFDFAWC